MFRKSNFLSSHQCKVITISIDAVLPLARALSDILYSIETRTPDLIVKEPDARVVINLKSQRNLR